MSYSEDQPGLCDGCSEFITQYDAIFCGECVSEVDGQNYGPYMNDEMLEEFDRVINEASDEERALIEAVLEAVDTGRPLRHTKVV